MYNSHADHQHLLRLALTCNASFSVLSGLLIIFADRRIVHFLGLPQGNSLLALGISLLAFAVFLLFSARRKVVSVAQAKIIVLMDILWVVGSYALLFVAPFSLGGKWLVGIVAEFVLAFAIAQWFGIRNIRKGQQYA
jgi:hypothetical protein